MKISRQQFRLKRQVILIMAVVWSRLISAALPIGDISPQELEYEILFNHSVSLITLEPHITHLIQKNPKDIYGYYLHLLLHIRLLVEVEKTIYYDEGLTRPRIQDILRYSRTLEELTNQVRYLPNVDGLAEYMKILTVSKLQGKDEAKTQLRSLEDKKGGVTGWSWRHQLQLEEWTDQDNIVQWQVDVTNPVYVHKRLERYLKKTFGERKKQSQEDDALEERFLIKLCDATQARDLHLRWPKIAVENHLIQCAQIDSPDTRWASEEITERFKTKRISSFLFIEAFNLSLSNASLLDFDKIYDANTIKELLLDEDISSFARDKLKTFQTFHDLKRENFELSSEIWINQHPNPKPYLALLLYLMTTQLKPIEAKKQMMRLSDVINSPQIIYTTMSGPSLSTSKESLEYLQSAILLSPAEPFYYELLAQIYHQMNDYQSALAASTVWLALSPDDPKAYRHQTYYLQLNDEISSAKDKTKIRPVLKIDHSLPLEIEITSQSIMKSLLDYLRRLSGELIR